MSDQARVSEFARRNHLHADPAARMLDLVSEVGEAAKELLKSTEYGQRPFQATAAWREELGDVYFALLCLADLTDVELSAALRQADFVLGQHLAQRGDAGSGR